MPSSNVSDIVGYDRLVNQRSKFENPQSKPVSQMKLMLMIGSQLTATAARSVLTSVSLYNFVFMPIFILKLEADEPEPEPEPEA